MPEQTRVPTRTRVPANYPKWGVITECDSHRPFLAVGEDEVTIVACQQAPGQHIGMYADCECCDCTEHVGPPWTSLRWNRNTPGALPATVLEHERVPVQEASDG